MVFHWIFTVLLVQIDFIVVSMFCNIKWVMDGVRLLSMECELCGRMATATVVAMAVKKTRIQITTVSVIISMRKLGNCIMLHRLNESKQPTQTHTHILSQALFQLGFTHPPGVSRQAESKPKWYGHYVCVEASDGCVCARVRTSHVTWDALSEIIDLKWQTKFSRLFLNWWERERESMRAQATKQNVWLVRTSFYGGVPPFPNQMAGTSVMPAIFVKHSKLRKRTYTLHMYPSTHGMCKILVEKV